MGTLYRGGLERYCRRTGKLDGQTGETSMEASPSPLQNLSGGPGDSRGVFDEPGTSEYDL